MIEAGQTYMLSFFRTALVPAALSIAILAQGAHPSRADEITKTWAIAEFGEPLYRDTFEYWPYANPDAPKGGKIVLGAFGTFDSFNTMILKGDWPSSIGLTGDGLMAASADELSAYYGVVAETVEYPADKSWAIFNIRPEARYHDGEPIKASDFVFTYNMMMEHGRPFLKSFFSAIEKSKLFRRVV